jgi:hypothetical protein
VIEAKCKAEAGRQIMVSILEAGTDVRTTFVALAEAMLRRRENDPTLTRLMLFSALENHRLSTKVFQTYVADYYEILSEHIRTKIVAGEFKKINPQIAARGFLGMLVYHSMVQNIFGGSRFQRFETREVAENLTDLWLSGMLAEQKRM